MSSKAQLKEEYGKCLNQVQLVETFAAVDERTELVSLDAETID
jgi:hypothetical protein